MRLLFLHVGAPETDRAEAIARSILAVDPDVAALAGVTKGDAARLLRDTLKAGGLAATTKGIYDPPTVSTAVALASAAAHAAVRSPFEGTTVAGCAIEVALEDGLTVAVVHAPPGDAGARFRRDALGDLAADLAGRPAVIAGVMGDLRGPAPFDWLDAFAAANPRAAVGDLPERVLISPAISRQLRAAYHDRSAVAAGLVPDQAIVVDLDL